MRVLASTGGVKPDAGTRGSSILMVLWGMMIMGMAVMGLIGYLRGHVLEEIEHSKAFEAHLLAESGLVLATHPAVQPHDPLLHTQVSAVKRYDVSITTEGARLAVNQLPQREFLVDACKRLFFLWGLDAEKAAVAAESLRDWIDGDDKEMPFGAEELYYMLRGRPDYPKNRPFRHLDEMLLVRGMEEVALLQPDWREFFTLQGDGTIDVNRAPSVLIEVVCDVPPELAYELIVKRSGPDLLEVTEDDTPFEDLDDVQEVLALEDREFAPLRERLTLQHPIRRIESTGRAGDFARVLTLITGPGVHVLEERDIPSPFTAANSFDD